MLPYESRLQGSAMVSSDFMTDNTVYAYVLQQPNSAISPRMTCSPRQLYKGPGALQHATNLKGIECDPVALSKSDTRS